MEERKILVSIREAVKATGLSEYAIRQGIASGWVPYFREGKCYKVHLPKLLKVLDERCGGDCDG